MIVPVVTGASDVHTEIPPQLRHINAFALTSGSGSFGRLATLVLETFRLLRSRRRLFISYKRRGSQPLAHRLYDALDVRGFDVFIDVRSVPPATDFQSELWHRMTDLDVIVLIDTPGFREGRWTAAELAQVNATSVQILHLLWPGQSEDPMSAFSHFLKLSQSDFFGHISLRGQFLKRKTLSRICDEAERLRARALAARQNATWSTISVTLRETSAWCLQCRSTAGSRFRFRQARRSQSSRRSAFPRLIASTRFSIAPLAPSTRRKRFGSSTTIAAS